MSVILIESDWFGFIHFWSSCLFYLSLISRTHINKLFYLSQQKLLKPYNKLIFKKTHITNKPLNSHGTRWLYPPPWPVVYCQDIYYGVFDACRLKLTWIMYFWCSKNVHFRWNFRRKNFVWKIFISPKDSFLNFRGSLLSYFWAIRLISAVISILEDFGSLLPARPVAVKMMQYASMLLNSSRLPNPTF